MIVLLLESRNSALTTFPSGMESDRYHSCSTLQANYRDSERKLQQASTDHAGEVARLQHQVQQATSRAATANSAAEQKANALQL